eukprot:scaffold17948_cov37-Cyclotella_meneghiniana.AAC.3
MPIVIPMSIDFEEWCVFRYIIVTREYLIIIWARMASSAGQEKCQDDVLSPCGARFWIGTNEHVGRS